jgi:aspartate/methionine/tyrosine aminotransferase
MFSGRVPDDRRPNRLSAALTRARAEGSVIDLTLSNPTRAGIHYPPSLLDALTHPEGLTYCPQPFGLRSAREAVADLYVRRGLDIDPRQIVLTASTSEAYSLLFKLLCDPGSEVLTPAPSYPLFDHLTRLDGVVERRYALHYLGGWSVDLADVDREWTDRTRAILIVSPNNPTGSILSAAEADELVQRAEAHHAAVIVDEVFHDYSLRDARVEEAPALQRRACLLFRLGGLSKTAGLPQMKLGWITVEGPDALVNDAMDRLELICDTYLSVSTPVQLAARALIDETAVVREQILHRIRTNVHRLRSLIAQHGTSVTLLEADGGWSAVLRVPAVGSEEGLVLDLLERDRVLVHPGFFFDFPHEAYLVVSLLPEPEAFAHGVRTILERVDAA